MLSILGGDKKERKRESDEERKKSETRVSGLHSRVIGDGGREDMNQKTLEEDEEEAENS